MKHTMGAWMLSVTLAAGVVEIITSQVDARELDQETYRMLSHGMTEPEVVGRAGQPDRRLDQFEPTSLNQRLVSYQYVWGGETNQGEWTTTITFSANTNKVIRIDRDRR